MDDIRDAPPKCCQQQSITVPPEAGAKFQQPLPHQSPEWRAHYAPPRSTNEGMNGVAKDHAYEALGIPGRRRIRGRAAQSVIVAFLVFAMNIRMIDSFIRLAVVSRDGAIRRPKAQRRKTAPLSDWYPAIPEDEGPPKKGSPPQAPNP